MNKGIFSTLSKYIKEILKNFGMKDSRPVGTPMFNGHKNSKKDDSTEVNQTFIQVNDWKSTIYCT